MTTIELRKKVIGKINQIKDDYILAEVYRLLENSDDDTEIFQITDNHKIAIEEAKAQISKGDFLTNEQANKDIDEWLNK